MKPVIFALVVLSFMLSASNADAQLSPANAADQKAIITNLASRPLTFTENRGQWDEKALFKAEAGGAAFWFCKDEVVYQFMRDTNELIEDGMSHGPKMPDGMPDKFNHPRYKKESMVLRAQFVGANLNPEIISEGRLSHNCNYFYGNDPSKWATDVPNYSSITYKDIYPGIDLKYHGDGKGMKYDFIVNPGADISQIQVNYEGEQDLSVTASGDLEARTAFGPINERAPYIYQEINGIKRQISGRYSLKGAGTFGFDSDGAYNPNYPLVIDPQLLFSTYLGGNDDDSGRGIEWDAVTNCVFVTGYTYSTNFPTQNPYQGSPQGDYDAFVTRMTSDGSSLVYSTYLGGSGTDVGCAVMNEGGTGAYLTGYTDSPNFPVSSSPYQSNLAGGYDAIVTQLNSAGNALYFSTYLGGTDDDYGYAISHDGNVRGWVCITGRTFSTNFPTTANAYQTYANIGDSPSDNAFVARVQYGRILAYSTYLGGNAIDGGHGIAVDANRNLYVTGWTNSGNFPVTSNPYQGYQGGYDAYVAKFNGNSNVVYITYLGGNDNDYGNGIILDGGGNPYITGETDSPNFPTVNPYQIAQGGSDGFVTKFGAGGGSPLYSTYLGGTSDDISEGIVVDGNGCAYITGVTYSNNFPVAGAFQTNLLGECDAFLSKLAASGSSLVYSTYLGGSADDYGNGVSVDANGSAYVTGETYSSDFPLQNPYQTYPGDASYLNAFVTKIGPPPSGAISGTITTGTIATAIEGVLVRALQYGSEIARDTTDINGQYSLPNLLVGSYDVEASKIGYITQTQTSIGVIANQITMLNFQLALEIPPCSYVPGDANGNGSFNGLDVSYSVSYFKGGPPPPYSCACGSHGTFFVSGDVNQSCSFNGLDVTYMVAYFKGGPPPQPCADCPPSGLLAPPAPGEVPAPAVQPVLTPTLNVKPKAGSVE